MPHSRFHAVPRKELAKVCLRLGYAGFGGGLAVLSQLRCATVEKRSWLNEREFLHAVSLAQVMPGGASANAITFLGLRHGGVRSALLCTGAYLLPGFLA